MRWIALFVLVCGCGGESDPPAAETPAETPPPATQATEAPEVEQPAEVEPEIELVELLHALPQTWVSASSAYRNDGRQVGRLVDGDLETAWNSMSDSNVASIHVRVPNGAAIHAVELTVGFTKVDGETDLFAGNRRVRRVELRSEGVVLTTADLDSESRELQRVNLDTPVENEDLEIRLVEFVPGTNERWKELCVSELRVLGVASEAAPDTRTPMVHLGPLPARDPSDWGQQRLDRLVAQDGDGTEEFVLTDSVRAFAGLFRNGRDETLDVRLVGGRCYVVVGQAFQQIPDDPGLYPSNIDIDVDGEAYVSDLDDPEPDILVGFSKGLCPEATTQAHMTLTGESMSSYWLHVFQRSRFADGSAEDGELDDGEGDEGASDDGATNPFILEREGLHLTELTLGPEVVDRQVPDARMTFSKATDERVYCLARLENPSREATSLRMGWERIDRPADPDDPSSWGREMNVPAQPRYVTFGYRGTGQRPAQYNCVIRDEDGTVLGRATYDLTD